MKVNLEKELIRQNRKIAAPAELLLINEYDRLGSEIATSETLSKIGINSAVKEGKEIKEKVISLKQQTEKFNQDRVFHVSQIRSICKRYYLKFLPSSMYKGSIDPQLPAKISQFEIAYSETVDLNNCFIAAPPSSFNLEERPKDPLLFYKINAEYYYLVHKWGRDLSVTRRLLPLFSSTFATMVTLWIVGLLAGLFIAYFQKDSPDKSIALTMPIAVMAAISIPVMCEGGSFVRKNIWNSKFRD